MSYLPWLALTAVLAEMADENERASKRTRSQTMCQPIESMCMSSIGRKIGNLTWLDMSMNGTGWPCSGGWGGALVAVWV